MDAKAKVKMLPVLYRKAKSNVQEFQPPISKGSRHPQSEAQTFALERASARESFCNAARAFGSCSHLLRRISRMLFSKATRKPASDRNRSRSVS
jgi:hypothetical protein